MGGQSQAHRCRVAVWWGRLQSLVALVMGGVWVCGNVVLAAGGVSTNGALFPRQSTVVLLCGLPGDVESENDYAQQLATWMDLAAASGAVQRLVVLCDQPSGVKLPEKVPGEVLKADRKSFLGLGQTLGKGTNPLVIIAWGHGGRQGSTPVFHVRGPRLTASDFKALADKAGATESRWVLMFRGSGAFAQQLAGPGREVLASESDTSFASDPVEMGLLLKLVRAEPGRSFAGLSEELGRNTAAWYRERNLARTEEPTLWMEQAKPRLLARAEEQTAEQAQAAQGPASIPEPAETAQGDQSAPPPTSAKPKPAAPAAVSAEVSASWKEIRRVEPQKYPGADGVILRQRQSYTLASSPAIASEQEEFIQILTSEGKRFGDFDVSYAPPFEDINFLDCEVLEPDGKLLRLDPDAIRESREASAEGYQAGQRKFFSLPGVVAGAVLHVRYRTQWERFPLPHVSLPIPVGHELPVAEATLEVSVPRDSAFHFAFERVAAPAPAIKQGSYGTTYSWHLENLPAEEQESLVAPGQQRRLLVSTFPDWANFAEWYGRISKLTDEVTPEIAAKAQELTRGATNDRARLLAVYDYVTGLRYVAVPLGVNSFRPHAAANVFHNQFGDCKDKANLFNALLHALKIEARLVLVPRFSQAQEGLPGLAFNHAISQVTLGGQTLWVDTTDDVCRFGLLPPGDPGRRVLVVDGHSTSLTQLPKPQPQEHVLKLQGQVKCSSSPARGMNVTLRAVGEGYPDYELRAAAREAKGHRSSLPLLEARFRPVAGALALEKQSTTSVAALDENFAWQAEGTLVGNATMVDGKGLVQSPFWVPKEWDVALHRRQAPLFLNLGYPLTLEEDFELTLPPGTQPLALPGVLENREEPLRWRIEWKKAGDGRVAAHFRAELVRGELSEGDTLRLQAQVRGVLNAMAASVTVAQSHGATAKGTVTAR